MKPYYLIMLITSCCLFISGNTFATDTHHKKGISLGYSYDNNHHGARLGYSNQRNRQHNKHYYTPQHSYKSYSKHKNNHYYNSRSRHNKYYYAPRYSHKSYSRHGYNHNSYRNKQNQRSCHPVSKGVVDNYGHHRIVGGTMCYNNHGQSYIVSGSRYYKH